MKRQSLAQGPTLLLGINTPSVRLLKSPVINMFDKKRVIENLSMLLWTAVFTAIVFYGKHRYDVNKSEKPTKSVMIECIKGCVDTE